MGKGINVIDVNMMMGTRHGMLNSTFSRNQFKLSTFHGLSKTEVDSNTEISVREAVRFKSTGDGQGFAKCSCKAGCARKFCRCARSNVLCNSRCHNTRAKIIIRDKLFNIDF